MKAEESRTFLLNKFREVTRGRLEKIGQALLDWEQNPSLPFPDDAGRELHTIKGEARMLGEVSVGHLAHSCESLLQAARDKSVPFAASLDLLFQAGEVIVYLLENPLPPNRALEISKKFCSTVAQTIGDGQLVRFSPMPARTPIRWRAASVCNDSGHSKQTLDAQLVPLSTAFAAFPRAIREMAKQQGKEVKLLFEQRELGIHRTMLTQLRDALVHLLRNAVDHGIENPEIRERQLKSRKGLIRIDVSAHGGALEITVEDDGRGMDANLLRQAAVSCGLISSSQSANLSERDVLELIFLPHFTTCTRVTEFSGRGMGMSVVKEKIESLDGSVAIQSYCGKGTRIVLRLPHRNFR